MKRGNREKEKQKQKEKEKEKFPLLQTQRRRRWLMDLRVIEWKPKEKLFGCRFKAWTEKPLDAYAD